MHPQRMTKGIRAILLAILIGTSLILTTQVNRLAGIVLVHTHPAAGWIATAAIPSCLAIGGLFFCLASRSVLRWPRLGPADRRSVVRTSVLWLTVWLTGSAITAYATGHWTTYAIGWPAILAFLVFGPVGEELLFRGLIFEQARRLWTETASPAIWLSTIAFSLHHIQLHRFPLDKAALAQLAFTVPMGLVFAQLRERSGSLWPALLLHVATNIPAAF